MIENRWHPMNHMPHSGDEASESENEIEAVNQDPEEISDTGSTVED